MRTLAELELDLKAEDRSYNQYLLQAYTFSHRNNLEELTFDDLPWGSKSEEQIEVLVVQMKSLGIKEFWVSESSTALKGQLIALMKHGVQIVGGEELSVPSPYLSFNTNIEVLKCVFR